MRKNKTEYFGSRVQKVAVKKNGDLKHIWESPWLDRFKEAGKIKIFQEA
jgi:hypothetical protein